MHSAGFSLVHRLTQRQQFQEVLRHGARFRVNSLTLVISPNGIAYSRLGIIIAKRNVAHAVERNRIKRLIRENFRKVKHELGGVDLVFMAFKGANALSNEELSACIDKLWLRLKNYQAKL